MVGKLWLNNWFCKFFEFVEIIVFLFESKVGIK